MTEPDPAAAERRAWGPDDFVIIPADEAARSIEAEADDSDEDY